MARTTNFNLREKAVAHNEGITQFYLAKKCGRSWTNLLCAIKGIWSEGNVANPSVWWNQPVLYVKLITILLSSWVTTQSFRQHLRQLPSPHQTEWNMSTSDPLGGKGMTECLHLKSRCKTQMMVRASTDKKGRRAQKSKKAKVSLIFTMNSLSTVAYCRSVALSP